MVMPLQQVIFFSSLFSLPFLLVFARLHPPAIAKLMPDLQESYRAILLLAFFLLLNLFFYFSAIRYTTIANAVFSHYTAPVFVAMFAPFFLNESLDRWTAISLPLSLAGLFLILAPGMKFFSDHSSALGIGCGVVSGIAYAATLLVAKKLTRGLSPVSIAFWQAFFIVLITAPLVVLGQPSHTPPVDWIIVLLLGIIHCSLAPLMYVSGLSVIKAQHVAVVGYLEPVSTIVLGALVLQEIPQAGSSIGGLLIFAAGFLVIWKGYRR